MIFALLLAGCATPAYRAHRLPAEPPPAPASYQAEFTTTEGTFVVQVQRDLAPRGADRFSQLVNERVYDDVAFFRAISGFIIQFGIPGTPAESRRWKDAVIPDDPVVATNARGAITFATSGPNTRTTQLFINLRDNTQLDGVGFAPFGAVVSGMDTVDRLYMGYGEGSHIGRGPDQGKIQDEGNEYLKKGFPELDYIQKVRILKN